MNALPNPFQFEDQRIIDHRRLRALANEIDPPDAGAIGLIAVALALGVPLDEEVIDLPVFLEAPRPEYLAAAAKVDDRGWSQPIVRLIKHHATPYRTSPSY